MERWIWGGIIALVVALCLYKVWSVAEDFLKPLYRRINRITGKLFKPFSRAAKPVRKWVGYVEGKLFKPNRHPKLARFGGLSQVIKMVFCLVFSIGVVLGMILLGGESAADMEVEILTSFPVFAILNMLVSSSFSYEALVQMSLFSILSIGFMRKNTGKSLLIRVTYDLIFTVFCTCLLYVIPDFVYGLPLRVTPFLRWLMRVFIDVPVINILMILVGTVLAIGVLYVILATYLRAFLDLFAAVAYALVPFTVLLGAVMLIGSLNWNRTVVAILYYAATLGVTYWQGIQRIQDEEDDENKQ